MSVTVIVLAAGQGSRFRAAAGADQDKLLADCVGRDAVVRPVIAQVLVNLPACAVKRVVVTSPDRLEVIRLAQAHGCEVVQLCSAGMGDSIAAAVAASGSSDGWLVVLGDMPFILPSSIERVLERIDGISVPVHAGQYGHPVAFGRAFGPALMALTGDRGAKPLFAQGEVREIQVSRSWRTLGCRSAASVGFQTALKGGRGLAPDCDVSVTRCVDWPTAIGGKPPPTLNLRCFQNLLA